MIFRIRTRDAKKKQAELIKEEVEKNVDLIAEPRIKEKVKMNILEKEKEKEHEEETKKVTQKRRKSQKAMDVEEVSGAMDLE